MEKSNDQGLIALGKKLLGGKGGRINRTGWHVRMLRKSVIYDAAVPDRCWFVSPLLHFPSSSLGLKKRRQMTRMGEPSAAPGSWFWLDVVLVSGVIWRLHQEIKVFLSLCYSDFQIEKTNL